MSRRVSTSLVAVLLLLLSLPSASAAQTMEPPDHDVESVVLEPGEEPLVDLVYAWQEGSTEAISIELWVANARYLGDALMEEYPPVPFRLDVSVAVERVDPDGSALVLATVEEASLIQDPVSNDGYDLAAELESLVGVRVRSKLDARGYLIASVTFDEDEEADDRHPARATALGLLEHLPIRLPTEPVGVGGTWEETVTTTASGMTGSETITRRITNMDAGEIELDTSSTVAMAQDVPGDAYGLDEPVEGSGRGTTSGSIRIDLAEVSPVVSVEQEGDFEFDLPVGEGVVASVELAEAVTIAPSGWEDGTRPVLAAVPETAAEDPPIAETQADTPTSAPGQVDVVVLDAGAEPRQELRYQLSEGQVEHGAMVMRMGVRTKLDGEWTDWLGMPPTDVAATTTVTAVREDGTYDIETVFTDVSVPADGQLPPDALAEYEAELANMIGLRQLLHMDERGRVLAAETVVPSGVSTGTMQPNQLDALVQDFIDPLPEEAVGIGAEWEVERVASDTMGFAVTGGNRLTLVELLPDGRLVLDGTIEMSAEPGPFVIPEMAFLDATIDRFSMDGGVSKIVDLGLVNPEGASDAISDYAFSVSFGETTETTEMQMSMEFESRLVETEEGDE